MRWRVTRNVFAEELDKSVKFSLSSRPVENNCGSHKRLGLDAQTNLEQAETARRQMRAFLGNRRLVFDTHYRRFFFVDQHPEIAERFKMTFESCFQEAAPAPAR
jgi:hypothetical protein